MFPRCPPGLLAAATAFGVTLFTWSWWRWWTFQYTTFDLAFYVQSLWCTVRGISVGTLLDVPLLGNHAEPSVYLALPLFALVPHPMLLVALQAAAVATMPLLAWRICQRLGLRGRNALILSLSTVLTPATAWATLHEFHPETFAAPLILALFLARVAERRVVFWLLWLVLAGCKENIALMLVCWGVLFAWLERAKGWSQVARWNLIPAFATALWLTAYAFWLGPWLNGGKVAYGELYSHLGSSGGEIIGTFFSDPARVARALLKGASEGDLLGGIVLPWLGLIVLRPRWLLLAAPLFLQHLLSWRSSEWSIRYHYGAPLVALTWIATAEVISRFHVRKWWCVAVLLGSIAGQAVIGPAKDFFHELGEAPAQLALRKVRAVPLDRIEPTAAVMASNGYLSHLAARHRIHSLHHLLKGLKTLSREEYVPPDSVEIILTDFTDATTFDAGAGFYHPKMQTRDGRIIPSSDALFDSYLRTARWTREALNGVSLFRRAGDSPPRGSGDATTLQIKNPHWEHRAPGDLPRVVIAYDVPAQRENYPWAILVAARGDERLSISLGLLAAGFQGENTEQWQIVWPQNAPAGKYQTTLIVYDNVRALWERRSPLQLPDTQQYGLGEIEIP